MANYIIKESELKTVINEIVAEEVSKCLNEGLLKGLLNTALLAGRSVVDPFGAAGKIYTNLSKLGMPGRGSSYGDGYWKSSEKKKKKKKTDKKK